MQIYFTCFQGFVNENCIKNRRCLHIVCFKCSSAGDYLPMFIWAATSAAKSSSFFSMPSPLMK